MKRRDRTRKIHYLQRTFGIYYSWFDPSLVTLTPVNTSVAVPNRVFRTHTPRFHAYHENDNNFRDVAPVRRKRRANVEGALLNVRVEILRHYCHQTTHRLVSSYRWNLIVGGCIPRLSACLSFVYESVHCTRNGTRNHRVERVVYDLTKSLRVSRRRSVTHRASRSRRNDR